MFPLLRSQTGHNALLVVVQNVSWQFCRDISIEELRKLNTNSVQEGKVFSVVSVNRLHQLDQERKEGILFYFLPLNCLHTKI